LDSLHVSWLIFGEGFRQGWLRTVVKRVLDLVVATLLLAVLWPLIAAIAIMIVLDSGFPIFDCQGRATLGAKRFRLVKFRIERSDVAQRVLSRWGTIHDSRLTRVGRALRNTRIDGLPQLCNVFMGDMSLVGPRPHPPSLVAQHTREIPYYPARHSVKPGITGWAQVRHHYGATVEDAAQALKYDLYYVKNHTLFLDTVILFETVAAAFTGAAGAHRCRSRGDSFGL
jgi:lipopolysaccharide/colanic/teichoic acid biosynthesis glycosyltransferase